jgi:hypothetical protein
LATLAGALKSITVIPAEAGIQHDRLIAKTVDWIPASAGMTTLKH